MIIEITLKVFEHTLNDGKKWYGLIRVQANRFHERPFNTSVKTSLVRTQYWHNGIGWQDSYAYCTLYATRQEAESTLKRMFGGIE